MIEGGKNTDVLIFLNEYSLQNIKISNSIFKYF